MLKDFAPGAQLPVLLYNGDSKTDTVTIEDFLEARLAPPTSVAGTALRGAKGRGVGVEKLRKGRGWQLPALLSPSPAVPMSPQVPQPGPAVQGVKAGWKRHLSQVLHLHQEPSACSG